MSQRQAQPPAPSGPLSGQVPLARGPQSGANPAVARGVPAKRRAGGDPYGDAYVGPPTMLHDVAFDDGYGQPAADSRPSYGAPYYGDEDELGNPGLGGDEDLSDEELDDEDGGRKGLGRLGKGMLIAVGVLLLLVLLIGFWVKRQIDPSGSPGDTVTVVLEPGQSTAEIAQTLNDEGVIGDARVFTIYARVRSKGDIQAGTYDLQTNMAMGDVLTVLSAGPAPVDEASVTIPEGLRLEEVVLLLSGPEGPGFQEDEVRAALTDQELRSQHLPGDAPSMEGTLFPETYALADDATPQDLVGAMVDKFDQVYGDLDVDGRLSDLPVEDSYELLTVASMIEEEAGTEADRAKIARVIYNRLESGMALGVDATACYEQPADQECQLTTEVLETSPYSTRREPGLPPTPITSPGQASIEAALNPADGDWIYYVLDVDADDGSHFFTADDQEFQDAKQRCVDAGRCG